MAIFEKSTVKLRVYVTVVEDQSTKSWRERLKTSINKTTRLQELLSKIKLSLKQLHKETVHEQMDNIYNGELKT